MRTATWITATSSCWLLLALPVTAQTTHPLVGKILETQTGIVTGIGDAALIPKLFPCGAITLLGEVHDNADHHQMRANLIEAATQRNSCEPRAFVFEQISADQQAGLSTFSELKRTERQAATPGRLFELIEWDTSGWPSPDTYAPLVSEVIRSKGSIVAGNPGRVQSGRVAKGGIAAISNDQPKLGLDKPLPPPLNDALLTELEASHCGLMPKSAFAGMAIAQRYRDAYMADVTLKAVKAGNAVVFAGNGHVRTDRGIPYYLRQRAPERRVVAVAFSETEVGKIDPSKYGPHDPEGKPAADFVAFAASAKRDDPCKGMGAQFKAKAKQP